MDEPIRIMGDFVQRDGVFQGERQVHWAEAWTAYHARRRLWSSCGTPDGTIRLPYLAVWPTHLWCGGARMWTASELASARSVHLLMRRRCLQWQKRDGTRASAGLGGRLIACG